MPWDRSRFEQEMKRKDPLLRLTRSSDGATYRISRKTRRGDTIHVLTVPADKLDQRALNELHHSDMRAYGGAQKYADALEAQEDREERINEQREHGTLLESSTEAYDKIRFLEGREVGGFHSKVKGWEPNKTTT